jgi:hypothetical protein
MGNLAQQDQGTHDAPWSAAAFQGQEPLRPGQALGVRACLVRGGLKLARPGQGQPRPVPSDATTLIWFHVPNGPNPVEIW